MTLPNKKYLIIIFISILVIAAYYYFLANSNSKSLKGIIVELSDDGFSPPELTIKKGETVTFITKRNKPFWPASDIHPINDIYPEFDPKRPIDPDKSWSFTFDRVGKWKYHDHFNPFHSAAINVITLSQHPLFDIFKKNRNINIDCSHLQNTKKKQCLEDKIQLTIKVKGLDETFNLLADIYNKDPDFASSCHAYAHLIGRYAYDFYQKKEQLKISAKTYYCGFGFYHGFMEALGAKGGNILQAPAFCNYIDDQLKNITPDAKGACYHGIGHGAADAHGLKVFEDEASMVYPALAICEKISPDKILLNRCTSGVFNVLAIAYNGGTQKFSINQEHPYWFCERISKEIYKRPCFEEMNTSVLILSKFNFATAAAYVYNLKEKTYAYDAMRSLSMRTAQYNISQVDHNDNIKVCKSLPIELKKACIDGYVSGLVENGAPGQEYILALNFCNNSLLAATEKDVCYKQGLYALTLVSPKERFKLFCPLIEEKYRLYCETFLRAK